MKLPKSALAILENALSKGMACEVYSAKGVVVVNTLPETTFNINAFTPLPLAKENEDVTIRVLTGEAPTLTEIVQFHLQAKTALSFLGLRLSKGG